MVTNSVTSSISLHRTTSADLSAADAVVIDKLSDITDANDSKSRPPAASWPAASMGSRRLGLNFRPFVTLPRCRASPPNLLWPLQNQKRSFQTDQKPPAPDFAFAFEYVATPTST